MFSFYKRRTRVQLIKLKHLPSFCCRLFFLYYCRCRSGIGKNYSKIWMETNRLCGHNKNLLEHEVRRTWFIAQTHHWKCEGKPITSTIVVCWHCNYIQSGSNVSHGRWVTHTHFYLSMYANKHCSAIMQPVYQSSVALETMTFSLNGLLFDAHMHTHISSASNLVLW